MNNTIDILAKSKKLIEKYGWTQGQYGGIATGFCALGAVYAVSPNNVTPTIQSLMAVLPRGADLVEYNDNPTMTKKRILNLFDKAINLLEEMNEKA